MTNSLDNLGGARLFSPGQSRETPNYGSIETESDPGHAGDADPQVALVRTAARLRVRAADSAIVRRRCDVRGRLALPGALQAGGARLGRSRMGRFGKQPTRQVLQADPRGAQTTRRRDLELGTTLRGDRQSFTDGVERGIRHDDH